jgi:hypothetical protein
LFPPPPHFFRPQVLARVASPAARARLISTTIPALSNVATDSFLSGTSSVYVEEMFRAWKANPGR